MHSGGIGQRVEIHIEQSFKKQLNASIELNQPLSSCDWDFSDEVGQKLLLYLTKNKVEETYHAIGTGYGAAVDEQKSDLYWLSGLPKSILRNRLSGSIQLYNDNPFNFWAEFPTSRF